jgi:hypothetical protein
MKNQLWLAQRRNAHVSFVEKTAESVCALIVDIEGVRWRQAAQAGRDRESNQLSDRSFGDGFGGHFGRFREHKVMF